MINDNNSIITKEILYYFKKSKTLRIILNKNKGAIIGFFLDIKIEKDTINHFKEFDNFNCTFSIGTNNFNKAIFLVDLHSNDCKECYGIGGMLSLLLKEGDKIFFEVMDNHSMYLEKAEIPIENWKEKYTHHPHYKGLHDDTLFITIYRKEKCLIRYLKLASEIYPDNSARSLRKK